MSKASISRRRFLRDIGVSAAALPFLTGLDSLYAKAATPVVPKKRFIFMYSPNGSLYYNWRTRVPGMEHVLDIDISDGTAFAAKNFLLRPLQPNAKKLLVVDRLSWISARQQYQTSAVAPDHVTHTGGHQKGMGSLLTGNVLVGGDGSFGTDGLADGISVDQVLATQLFAGTNIPSLEIGVQVDENLKDRYVDKRVSYNAPIGGVPQPRTPQNDPFQLFSRVFGGNPVSGTPVAGPSLRSFLDQSVLDAAVKDFTRVQTKLSAGDRLLLQQHSDSIRKLETQLMAPAVSCAMETAPTGGGYTITSDPTLTKKWAMTPANFPLVGSMMTEIAVQAIACGITNVITFMWANSENDLQYPWLPIPYGNGAGMTTSGHHGMSHARDPNLVTIDQWYATQFNTMITKLDAIQDSNTGSTILDNSLMMWSSCLGDASSHFSDNVPIVLAGSNGGYFKSGRLVRMNDVWTTAQWAGDPVGPEMPIAAYNVVEDKARVGDQKTVGSPDLSNNDLMVTILESFGLDPTANAAAFKPFQDPRFYHGPLTSLKKA